LTRFSKYQSLFRLSLFCCKVADKKLIISIKQFGNDFVTSLKSLNHAIVKSLNDNIFARIEKNNRISKKLFHQGSKQNLLGAHHWA